MKQPTFHGRVLLPLSVFADARAGDPLAMERILRYYDGYMNKLCIFTLRHLFSGLFLRTFATALRALYGIARRICRTLINQTGTDR